MARRMALTPNVDVMESSPFEAAGGPSKGVQTFMNKVAELENRYKKPSKRRLQKRGGEALKKPEGKTQKGNSTRIYPKWKTLSK